MKTNCDSVIMTPFLSLYKMAASEAAPSSAHAHMCARTHTCAHTDHSVSTALLFLPAQNASSCCLGQPRSVESCLPCPFITPHSGHLLSGPVCSAAELPETGSPYRRVSSTQPRSISRVIIFKPFIYSFSLVYLPSPQKIFGWSDFL